ncbi:MAG: hypothetical protein IJS15_06870 [Victivallales bacterium]|nr:hypothetical protein [Victivallales bacterium]
MKRKQKKDKLAVCLAWHAPKANNALDSDQGRTLRFLVFALACAGGILALVGAFKEFL